MSAHPAPPPSKKQRKSIEEDSVPTPEFTKLDHINLTSHTDTFGVDPIPVSWGHPDPLVRGPVICTVRHSSQRNAIGAHSGSYCIYTGLAVAAGKLNPEYVPNLKLTSPVFGIGPHASWYDPKKIASIDPFGHVSWNLLGRQIPVRAGLSIVRILTLDLFLFPSSPLFCITWQTAIILANLRHAKIHTTTNS